MTVAPPRFVSRASWGAAPGHASVIRTPTAELWGHHTGGDGGGAGYVRYLQRKAFADGLADIAYNFVIDPLTALVYVGRGPGYFDGATYLHGSIANSICVMGNYESRKPVTPQLVDVLARLIAYGRDNRWWATLLTGPHAYASGNATACWGKQLIAAIPTINARAATLLNPNPPQTRRSPLTTVAFPYKGGRRATARPLIDRNVVLLQNGARVRNDVGSGQHDTYTWQPASLPPGSRLVDIAAVDVREERPLTGQVVFTALYGYPDGSLGTYDAQLP